MLCANAPLFPWGFPAAIRALAVGDNPCARTDRCHQGKGRRAAVPGDSRRVDSRSRLRGAGRFCHGHMRARPWASPGTDRPWFRAGSPAFRVMAAITRHHWHASTRSPG